VQEETGLSVKKLRLAGTLVVDASDEIGIMIFILIGESLVGEPVPSGEGELHWVALDALSDLPLVEDLPVLLPRILAMQPGDEPFSARAYYDETDRIQVRFA
jgi:8-oxo-dGTP pyrophosphatase MutT (NUDIX family)